MAQDHHQRVPLSLRRASAAGAWAAGATPSGGVVHRLLLAHEPRLPGLGLDGSGLGPHAGTLASLALDDPDEVVRWSAVQALRGLGPAAAPYLPVLDRIAVRDAAESVRQEARHARAVGFSGGAQADRVAAVLHPAIDAPGRGGPALLALAGEAPEAAFDLAAGLLDHDLRPLAVAAAQVVGRVASRDPQHAGAWCRDGLRRLQHPAWGCREVGAYLLAALAEARLPEGLAEEAFEALVASASSEPDDDVRRAAGRAVAAWRAR
jgi:hypothetical protein